MQSKPPFFLIQFEQFDKLALEKSIGVDRGQVSMSSITDCHFFVLHGPFVSLCKKAFVNVG